MVAANNSNSVDHTLAHDPQQRRHPLFSQNSIFIQKSTPPPDTWTKIIPSTKTGISIPGRGRDVNTIYSDPLIGAQNLLHQCQISSPDALLHLHECLSLFQDVTPDATSYRAKIFSSRGHAGTRCPKWHVDYVSVRLICALEGPGVCWLESGGEKRDGGRGANESDELDSKVVNSSIVNAMGAGVVERSCEMGDIALLMGKMWEEEREGGCECCDDDGRDVVRAAMHKSPELLPSQGRVLLTVDTVEEEVHFTQ